MQTVYYTVLRIDGDYASLQNKETKEINPVALALLPSEIMEGNTIKYEMFEYEIID